MFGKKQNVLTNLLPVKEADKIIEKFRAEVAASAKKYGIDCYAVVTEFYALNENGERGSWFSRASNGPALQLAGLMAWAYGVHRGTVETILNSVKQSGFTEGEKLAR